MLKAIRSRVGGGSHLWLVCEFTGYLLRAWGVRVRSGKVRIEGVAESRDASVDEAFGECLGKVKRMLGDVPPRALLLCGQAAASIVELPVNPASTPKASEMRELVRWEVEQILGDQLRSVSLDTILVGRGCLSSEQVGGVRESLLQSDASLLTLATPKRLADEVVRLGLASRKAVEDCLEVLTSLEARDEVPFCHWERIAEGEQAPGENGYPWLVCGMSRRERKRWFERFDAMGVKLERIYPLACTSAAAVGDAVRERFAVIDLLEGADYYCSFSGNQPQAIRWGSAPLSPRKPEGILNLIGTDSVEGVWLSGTPGEVSEVSEALARESGCCVRAFPRAEVGPAVNGEARVARFDGVVGAVRHFEGMTGRVIPWLPATEPGPSWWFQPKKWWCLGAVFVLVLVSVVEGTFAIQRGGTNLAVDQIKARIEALRNNVAQTQSKGQRVQALEEAIRREEERRLNLRRTSELLRVGLPLRHDYVLSLFTGLSQAVSPSVVVDQMRENRDHAVEIRAWALTEREAQEFGKKAAADMMVWGLGLSHLLVKSRAGRLGLPGYDLDLELRPTPASPAAVSARTRARR